MADNATLREVVEVLKAYNAAGRALEATQVPEERGLWMAAMNELRLRLQNLVGAHILRSDAVAAVRVGVAVPSKQTGSG